MRSKYAYFTAAREIGATSIEYALVLACASVAVLVSSAYVGRSSNETVLTVGKSIEAAAGATDNGRPR